MYLKKGLEDLLLLFALLVKDMPKFHYATT